jgi:hypothetical protein
MAENAKKNWTILDKKLVQIGIGIGILSWFFEAAIHSFIFFHGNLINEIFVPDPHELWMRSFIVFLFITFGFYAQSIVNLRKKAESEKDASIIELQKALDEVKILRGLIPICASCKKIRDDKGFWQQLEVYISAHSDAEFSHGICPECKKKLYPEFVKDE